MKAKILLWTGALLLLWGAYSCHAEKKESAPPGTTASGTGAAVSGDENRLDESRSFLDPLNLGNLTVWPIISETIKELGEFLTLGEAQEKGVAVVKEIGAAGGSASAAAGPAEPVVVRTGFQPAAAANNAPQLQLASNEHATVNKLMIENKGEVPILVCGGTIVKGGKQDRQIGQDFVIAPGSETPVDAFCVEARRWTESREGKDTGGMFFCTSFLAPQAVRASAQYAVDQHSVWASVDSVNAAAGNSPETATLLATIEDADKEAVERRDSRAKKVCEHFKRLREGGKAPVGFAYAVNGKPVTVRTFAHPRILEGQLEPFVKAMCLEADLAGMALGKRENEGDAVKASLKDVLQLVREINKEKEELKPMSAASRVGLRKGASGGNSNCYVPAPGARAEAMVPVTQDWTSAR